MLELHVSIGLRVDQYRSPSPGCRLIRLAPGQEPLGAVQDEKGVCPMARRSSSSKVTSGKVAKQASAILRDGRSSARSKSVAASALAQARSKRK